MSDYAALKIEAQRVPMFETPVVLARFNNAEGLLTDLETAIRKTMASDEGVKRSNVGGWHSDTHMLDWGGPAAKTLSEKAIAMAKRLSLFANASHEDFDWWCQLWANVSGSGAWNHMHIHPGNLWSAVLYLDMGDEGGTAGEVGGEFYFEDPRFPAAAMHNTRFRYPGADGQPAAWQPELKPKRGDFIMFPAWLRHGVRPYTGKKERISIALNVDAIPK
ncbi:MAG: TIGR02466 family protein [Pseudomonadota bacterium]